jgi:NAD(P)-dependent dehydrogenase (short-subunit alcohol dehydrogenase family)
MKTAIVTGAGQGLGADIAATLAANGYRVGVLDVNAEQAHATAERIGGVALAASVSDAEQVARALDAFGETPDLLVNGAGIVRFGELHEQSIDDYRAVIEVNLMGPLVCSRAVAPGMLERGSGHIIHITSVNGIHPAPKVGVYGATKAGLASLTQLMSLELGPALRVNAIAPGFIDAGMSRPIYADPRIRELRGGGVPLKRLGEASDIAGAVLFLDSEQAAYINGHELVVDGGVVNSVFLQLPRE